MNNKGQALIEFILILPLFFMILFIIVDFGVVFSSKASLENTSHDIVNLIQQGVELEEIRKLYPDLSINLIINSPYITLTLEKEVDLITPGVQRILEDPYPISTERILPYEETQ